MEWQWITARQGCTGLSGQGLGEHNWRRVGKSESKPESIAVVEVDHAQGQ